MRGRHQRSRDRRRVRQPERLALILGALSVLVMPQTYRGGADAAHPHAIFQFWPPSDQATAAHHHADDDPGSGQHTHGDDREFENRLPGTDSSRPTVEAPRGVPAFAPMTASTERTDANGGAVAAWLMLLPLLAAAWFGSRRSWTGRLIRPPTPPPRLLDSGGFRWG